MEELINQINFTGDEITAPTAKGRRVRAARMLAGLNRKELRKKYLIPENTLKSWENPVGKQKGLTDKGANRLAKCLLKAGVLCSSEWLLFGKGPGPQLIIDKQSEVRLEDIQLSTNQEESILREVQFFLDINAGSTATMISNNKMAPLYNLGDYVGGYKVCGTKINQLINTDCIIELDNEIKIVGRFHPSHIKGLYNIIYLNNNHTEPSMNDDAVSIKCAAKIVWHRTKDNLYEW